MTKEREMIENFIAYEIEENDYYENLHEQAKNEEDVVSTIYNVFLNYFSGYYSIWTIMDTIEHYLKQDKEEEQKRTIKEIVDSEYFEIIDRF